MGNEESTMPVKIAVQTSVTPEEHEIIRSTIAVGATKENYNAFIKDCERLHVHPLEKLIHFTQRKDKNTNILKYTPIISIDYMRMNADLSGKYIGCSEPEYTYGENNELIKCKLSVQKLSKGLVGKFTAIAFFKEYKPEFNNTMWVKMPHLMLAKVTEANALRKAFPRQLHGFYIPEEMEQANVEYIETQQVTARQIDLPDIKSKEIKPVPNQKLLIQVENDNNYLNEVGRQELMDLFNDKGISKKDITKYLSEIGLTKPPEGQKYQIPIEKKSQIINDLQTNHIFEVLENGK